MREHLARLLVAVALVLTSGSQASGTEIASSAGELLEISSEIDAFLSEKVRVSAEATETVQSLLDAILGARGLALDYNDDHTRKATETFDARSGNCLSFTVLFVAMARHLGLDARFVEVTEVMSWGRRGDVVWSSRHMIAEVSTASGLVQVDFLPELEKRYRSIRRISDQRTLAHYYNNLGVEMLAERDVKAAQGLFRRALVVDDSFTPAWVNQGVAFRHLDQLHDAERSYKQALKIDPAEMTAASNLSLLYDALGRPGDAAEYERLVRRYRRRNPFFHFSLGLQASKSGDPEAAVTHFKRAIRRQRREPGFHAELARAYEELGQRRRARRSLGRAVRHAVEVDQKQDFERRLANLRSAGAG